MKRMHVHVAVESIEHSVGFYSALFDAPPVVIKPDYAKAHVNLGIELFDRRQVDEAIEHYRAALAIEPNYVVAHLNLGVALAEHKKNDEALEHYRKALDLATTQNNSALADNIRAKLMGLAGRGD